MRVDPLAIAGQFRELLAHRLLLVQSGLARIEQRRTDQHVGEIQDALRVGKRRVAMQVARMNVAARVCR